MTSRSVPKIVEPVEAENLKPRRKFAVEPVETSTKSTRRILPSLLDASPTPRNAATNPSPTLSNVMISPTQSPSPAKRRFSPQPVESTTRSNRNSPKSSSRNIDKSNLLPHERDWTSSSSNSSPDDSELDQTPLLSHERSATIPLPQKPAPRRRFAPQLIETAKRVRKIGDTGPAVLPHDKTNISPGDALETKPSRPHVTPLPPSNTPITSQSQVPLYVPRPNRQGSIHAHYNTRANTRAHSFKVPELEAIDSSGSDNSPPSLSRTHSATSEQSEDYKHATRMRESADDRFSGYLLALAAKAAEKQLRDAEAAAFANTDLHERISHYVDADEEDEEMQNNYRHGTRRDSGDDKFALMEMQQHGEKIKEQQQGRKAKGFNVEFDSEPSLNNVWPSSTPKNMIGGYQKDPDLKPMRKAASPPMLGGDIDFPRCPSPEHARFDVTQGADFLRNSMCYLTAQSTENSGGGGGGAGSAGGLWASKNTTTKKSSGWQRPASPQRPSAAGGLWGGRCTKSDAKQAAMPTGLMTPIRTPQQTPAAEREDPFAAYSLASGNGVGSFSIAGKRGAPPSPPASANSSSKDLPTHLGARLEAEVRLENEFNDAFVTQVYNYLSLGFPALARKFDDELSRISRVPIADLRTDDALAEVRGYVRFEADETLAAGVSEDMCARWRALKIYVREWGRQQMAKGANLDGSDPHRAWGLPSGLPDRRGSWGI